MVSPLSIVIARIVGELLPATVMLASYHHLRDGQNGAAVRQLQVFLRAHGATHLWVDGVLNPQTRSAIASFQRDQGLPADGTVTPQTWEALRSFVAVSLPLTPDLPSSEYGRSICQLQTLLRSHYATVRIDGVLSCQQVALVKRFQAHHHLSPTGIVDQETWDRLCDSVLSVGATGDRVHGLQTALRTQGYRLAVDGCFGIATATAVMDFQQRHGLPSDGLVGRMTTVVLQELSRPLLQGDRPTVSVQAPLYKVANLPLPHQRRALEWLRSQIPDDILSEFIVRWGSPWFRRSSQ